MHGSTGLHISVGSNFGYNIFCHFLSGAPQST
uniref:Photosystem II protein T n=1 Tax=Diplazium stenochlamys TaxID=1392715 RepID=A0A6B9M9N8_9MONI|nr:photosystem II protein T [Diplazium stenochlamys]